MDMFCNNHAIAWLKINENFRNSQKKADNFEKISISAAMMAVGRAACGTTADAQLPAGWLRPNYAAPRKCKIKFVPHLFCTSLGLQ